MSRRPDTHHHPDVRYRQAYDALYGRATGRKGRYRRDRLPDPSAYYEAHLDGLLRRGDWASVCCPFHQDQRPSLSVNLKHGGFKGHACGASGGDVLDFHRRLTGMGFI